MKVICTVCSNKKNKNKKLLPAYLRYISPRIKKIRNIAKKENLPFFILSGKFGLISDTESIQWYDHLLKKDEVQALTKKVIIQMRDLGITELLFYKKQIENKGWEPYYELIQEAVLETSSTLHVCILK